MRSLYAKMQMLKVGRRKIEAVFSREAARVLMRSLCESDLSSRQASLILGLLYSDLCRVAYLNSEPAHAKTFFEEAPPPDACVYWHSDPKVIAKRLKARKGVAFIHMDSSEWWLEV